MKKKIIDIVYSIDASEKTKYFLGASQVLIVLFAFLYTRNTYPKFAAYGFFVSWTFVLSFFILMVAISGKYKAIRLRLNKDTGVLFDKRLQSRNVSLRADTLSIILDSIGPDKLCDVGEKVGQNFYDSFIKCEREIKGDLKMDTDKLLERWMEYDSSSGMGLFRLIKKGMKCKIVITTPFTGECTSSGCRDQKCEFLKGYIKGFGEKLYNSDIVVKCITTDYSSKKCCFEVIVLRPTDRRPHLGE